MSGAGDSDDYPPDPSARGHVTGGARFVDDLPTPAGTLHAYLGLSTSARARIAKMDLDPVRRAPGVVGVLERVDVPGLNDLSPQGMRDEPIFADGRVEYVGQALFAVVAESREQARRAARLAEVTYDAEQPILDIELARAVGGRFVAPPLALCRGDVAAALERASRRVDGRLEIGGQDHFYLEGQVALAIPGEDGAVHVESASQSLSKTRILLAKALGVAASKVTVACPRVGGGFGGKATQAALYAAVAALAAARFERAVKIRLDRDDDMAQTGKSHDFLIDYALGFDDAGKIEAVEAVFAARCGRSADFSGPIVDRALLHADGAYFLPAVALRSEPLRTNTITNTNFVGLGARQGALAAERMIDEIACALGRDPLAVRKANFYDAEDDRDITPYHERIATPTIARLVAELETRASYDERRSAALSFNASSPIVRRGLALTPIRFGLSLPPGSGRCAGAMLHILEDGSVELDLGGVELGQGLHVRVRMVVAAELTLKPSQVQIGETRTDKVSQGSPRPYINGVAALEAARVLKRRLTDFAAVALGVAPEEVTWRDGGVWARGRRTSFEALAHAALKARVPLTALGYSVTPEVEFDREAGKGAPFYDVVSGAALSEVEVDTLTGECRLCAVDVIHDGGVSEDPVSDRVQVEGGFMLAYGGLTSEKLNHEEDGRLSSAAPRGYAIPLAADRPPVLDIALAPWAQDDPARRGRALGEMGAMFAISAHAAISMAVASVADYRICPRLDTPATPERVLMAVERLRRGVA